MVGIALYILSIIVATALGVAAFVLMMNANDNCAAKQIFKPKRQVVLITPEGDIIDTKEGVDVELDILNHKLKEKQDAILKSKDRISLTLNSIQKLVATKHEISKHFANLKYEIDKAERDCKDLKSRISNYNITKEQMVQEDLKSDSTDEDICQKVMNFIKKDEPTAAQVMGKSMLNEPIPIKNEQGI